MMQLDTEELLMFMTHEGTGPDASVESGDKTHNKGFEIMIFWSSVEINNIFFLVTVN